MPTVKLTKRTVEQLTHGWSQAGRPADQFWWDAATIGLGVKVTPAGARLYVVQWRTGKARNGSAARLTIGRHGAPWTLDQARQEAKRVLAEIAMGNDPRPKRRQAPAPALTVKAVIADFIERDQKPKNRTWRETERTLNRDLEAWHDRPITGIGRRDVLDVIDTIADRGAPVQARLTLAFIRRMLNWCCERGILEANPAAGVKPPTRPVSRDRIMSDEELRDVIGQLDAVGQPFGLVVRLLILTAQRRDEVGGMTQAELDLSAAIWTIPRERSKNDKAHAVPLSKAAVAALQAAQIAAGDAGYVFTVDGRRPFNGFSKAKQRLNELVNAARAETGRPAMAPWRLHDLRRTAASGMARLGTRSEVIERVLNHAHPGGSQLSSVYQRYEFEPEMRAALEKWGRHVENLKKGKGSA